MISNSVENWGEYSEFPPNVPTSSTLVLFKVEFSRVRFILSEDILFRSQSFPPVPLDPFNLVSIWFRFFSPSIVIMVHNAGRSTVSVRWSYNGNIAVKIVTMYSIMDIKAAFSTVVTEIIFSILEMEDITQLLARN